MPKIDDIAFEEKRAHIVTAARMVFADKGYQAATIKDILLKAGISNGALFVYFPSKRDILLHIIDENLGLFHARIEDIINESHRYEREDVLIMLLELVRQISLSPGRAMSLHAWSAGMVDPIIKKRLDLHFARILKSLTSLIDQFKDRGQLAKSTSAARVAQALFAFFLPGYILQLLMFPTMEPQAYLMAHRGLWQGH